MEKILKFYIRGKLSCNCQVNSLYWAKPMLLNGPNRLKDRPITLYPADSCPKNLLHSLLNLSLLLSSQLSPILLIFYPFRCILTLVSTTCSLPCQISIHPILSLPHIFFLCPFIPPQKKKKKIPIRRKIHILKLFIINI